VKKHVSFLALTALFNVPTLTAKMPADYLNDIASIHLAGMPAIILPGKTRKILGQDIPRNFSIKDYSDYERYTFAYKTFAQVISETPEEILNAHARKELELLCGSHTPASNLVTLLNETSTTFGHVYFSFLISYPTANVKTLTDRQGIIKKLLSDKALFHRLSSDLAAIKKSEAALINCLQEENALEKQFLDMYYSVYKKPILKKLNALNNNVPLQELSVIHHHISNFMLPLTAPLIVSWFGYVGFSSTLATQKALLVNQDMTLLKKAGSDFVDGITHPSWKAIGWFAALEPLAIWIAHDESKQYCDFLTFTHEKTNSLAAVIRTARHLALALDDAPELENLTYLKHTTDLFKTRTKAISADYKKLVTILSTTTFEGKVSLASRKGRVVAAFSLLRNIRKELAPLMLAIAELDAYIACTKLYKKYEDKPNTFSFATYLTQDTPQVTAENIWNPFVGAEKSVTNSIQLGQTLPLNVILSGPNAGGKSTFLKGLTLDILLAQTIGIVPASSFSFTPFAKITTYMNIADDTAGGNSLFKSEVLRAQELMDTIEKLDKSSFAFSIMDEMFSGTSPKEGEAATYAVAEDLGSHPNSILLLASHFPKIKELETTTKNFKNYQVRVVYNEDGTFSYPYKLTEGAADQIVAIDILKDQGFKGSIVEKANKILGK
jgi:DNA mismatch repair protein MutS